MAEEKTLNRFIDPQIVVGWTAIHDVVMGGRSAAGMKRGRPGR